MQCTNNLKQLAIAVHNHHDVHNRIVPNGVKDGNLDYQRSSYLMGLLPFVEQTAVYENAKSSPNYAGTAGGREAWKCPEKITGFICPSDGNAPRVLPALGNSSPTNYHCSSGDTWSRWESTLAKRSLFCREIKGSPTLASATDGTSNTVLLGEAVTASNLSQSSGTSGAIKGSVASISAIKDNNVATQLPKTCADSRIAGNKVGNGANVDCASIGTRWADCFDVFTMFSCVLPPNSPSCSSQGPTVSYWSMQFTLVSLSSFHTGGANVAFADGSIHFISETINCETAGTTGLNHSADESELAKAGQSPYGIIGALGPTNGGDAVSLP